MNRGQKEKSGLKKTTGAKTLYELFPEVFERRDEITNVISRLKGIAESMSAMSEATDIWSGGLMGWSFLLEDQTKRLYEITDKFAQ